MIWPSVGCVMWKDQVGKLSHSWPSRTGDMKPAAGQTISVVVFMMEICTAVEDLGMFRSGAGTGWIGPFWVAILSGMEVVFEENITCVRTNV